MDSGLPYLMNMFIDEASGANSRPGLALWSEVPYAAQGRLRGIFWWKEKSYLVAVVESKIFVKKNASTPWEDITGDALAGAGVPPQFASNGTWLYIADGGALVRWNGTGTTVQETDVNAPTNATKIAYIDGMIIANSAGSNEWHFAEPGEVYTDPLTWSFNSLTAEAQSDAITAMAVAWREIYLLGNKSCEIWVNTGTDSVFERTQYIERGIVAPETLAAGKNTLFWLDDNGEVIALEGRTPRVVSKALAKEISRFSTLSTATATTISVGGRSWYVIMFPSNQRSFALDLDTMEWAEWSYWNTVTAKFEHYLGSQFVYCQAWGLRLITGRVREPNPKIYQVSEAFCDDAGSQIRRIIRTAHLNFGTFAKKQSNQLSITLKRGALTNPNTDEPYLKLRWRNDGKPFGTVRRIGLGKAGESEMVRVIQTRGQFRTRQYELEVTDSIPVAIRALAEDVEEVLV